MKPNEGKVAGLLRRNQFLNKKYLKITSNFVSRLRENFDVNLAVVLFGLGAFSALKGLNLIVSPYTSYFYYTDYRFGFVLRGLVGQLFSPVLAMLPQSAHGKLLIVWHFAALAVLLVALSRLAAQTIAATGRADVLAMAALLFCSPLIPSLAYFTAAPDVLLCLLTLGLVAAIRAQRLGLAWLIFLVGTLAHQLMIFIALPVMVLSSLIDADRPGPAVVGSIAVGVAACLVVLTAPAPDARFISRFVEQGIKPSLAQGLHEFQLGQTPAEMLGVMADLWRQNLVRGVIGVTYGASAGAVILAWCLLSSGVIRPVVAPLAFLPSNRLKIISAALLVLGTGLSPLLVLAFALDLSRLAVLSIFTAFLVADMLLRRAPDRTPLLRSRLVAFACSTLAVVFFCLPFMGLWLAGSHLNTRKPLVRNPILEIGAVRTVVEGFLEFYGGGRWPPTNGADPPRDAGASGDHPLTSRRRRSAPSSTTLSSPVERRASFRATTPGSRSPGKAATSSSGTTPITACSTCIPEAERASRVFRPTGGETLSP